MREPKAIHGVLPGWLVRLSRTLFPAAALRFLSMLLLLIATVVFAADLMRSGTPSVASLFTPLGQHWSEVAPASYASTRKAAAGGSAMWHYVLNPLLRLPGWITFGSLGVICGYLGRHRRQVNIFIN